MRATPSPRATRAYLRASPSSPFLFGIDSGRLEQLRKPYHLSANELRECLGRSAGPRFGALGNKRLAVLALAYGLDDERVKPAHDFLRRCRRNHDAHP